MSLFLFLFSVHTNIISSQKEVVVIKHINLVIQIIDNRHRPNYTDKGTDK
jgi:hypothetical protein